MQTKIIKRKTTRPKFASTLNFSSTNSSISTTIWFLKARKYSVQTTINSFFGNAPAINRWFFLRRKFIQDLLFILQGLWPCFWWERQGYVIFQANGDIAPVYINFMPILEYLWDYPNTNGTCKVQVNYLFHVIPRIDTKLMDTGHYIQWINETKISVYNHK